jgi:hypothetical protein
VRKRPKLTPLVVGLAARHLERLALRAGYRSTRDRHELSFLLDLENPTWQDGKTHGCPSAKCSTATTESERSIFDCYAPRRSGVDDTSACAELKPIYRRLLKMFLEELQSIDQQLSPRRGGGEFFS